jgi:tetratricopeptide (TPR) repeat protein
MNHQNPVHSRLFVACSGLGQYLRGTTGIGMAAATVFLLVAGIGAATSYWPNARETVDAPRSMSQDDTLARLKDYTRTIGPEHPAPAPAAGKMLPDVSTMIEKLAARLETAPDDVKGWRMLGWSYFHTERYAEAAKAYEKAVALDPNSADLKQAYEEANAKASGGDRPEKVAPTPAVAESKSSDGKHGDGSRPKATVALEAMSPNERDAAIRSMVDGLADRLARSPRDVEGWTRLMRSRVVLGEREVAAAAFRTALDVFKDDTAASASINAAAIEFGLKAE